MTCVDSLSAKALNAAGSRSGRLWPKHTVAGLSAASGRVTARLGFWGLLAVAEMHGCWLWCGKRVALLIEPGRRSAG
jgi:hypothetical protein